VESHTRTSRSAGSVTPKSASTEGWSEERLASLVTRDSMIGTGQPTPPAGSAS